MSKKKKKESKQRDKCKIGLRNHRQITNQVRCHLCRHLDELEEQNL